jgi:hypothetical protein
MELLFIQGLPLYMIRVLFCGYISDHDSVRRRFFAAEEIDSFVFVLEDVLTLGVAGLFLVSVSLGSEDLSEVFACSRFCFETSFSRCRFALSVAVRAILEAFVD